MVKFNQYYQASEIRQQMLQKQFQEISDVDLVEELKRQENIKLSMYPNQDQVYLKVKDIRVGTWVTLPFTLKKEKENE